jgi:peptidoglycan/LPS O-acetylase OafA/YrhL
VSKPSISLISFSSGWLSPKYITIPLRWFVFLFSTITASALLYHYVEESMIALGHRLSNQLQERRDAPEVAPAN